MDAPTIIFLAGGALFAVGLVAAFGAAGMAIGLGCALMFLAFAMDTGRWQS